MIQQKEFYNKYWINRNNETNQPDIGWIYEKQRIDSYLLKIVMASINNSFNLLEIGLGKGDLAFKICQQTSQYSDMKYFGIDLSEDGVRIAQERVDQRFSFSVGDATHLNFESKRFDMVICSEVIEHIVDKSKIISEIKRVLKTDGTLLLTTPNPQALTYALPKFLNLFHKYCFLQVEFPTFAKYFPRRRWGKLS
jgi:ubiquinone/menaquinone biosynthesis C-methylase UbiE